MYNLRKALLVIAAVLAVLGLAAGSFSVMADDSSARKDKILENLKLKFPQLRTMSVTMGEFTATEWGGLEQGSFVVNGRPQVFLVSSDDKKLYLVSGEPIDVSKSADEIQAEVAKQEAEKLEAAKKNHETLLASVGKVGIKGPANAPVTIVEFSDFQCPYCGRGSKTVEEILAKYGDDVRVVFKHFPLGFHPWAKPAAIASICAGRQDDNAFWTLHDEYFEHQKEINPGNVLAKSKEYLASTGIDMAKWSSCAEDTDTEEYKSASAEVDADMEMGQSLGVSGTPGFFVNGQFLNGAQPLSAFEPLIEAAKKG